MQRLGLPMRQHAAALAPPRIDTHTAELVFVIQPDYDFSRYGDPGSAKGHASQAFLNREAVSSGEGSKGDASQQIGSNARGCTVHAPAVRVAERGASVAAHSCCDDNTDDSSSETGLGGGTNADPADGDIAAPTIDQHTSSVHMDIQRRWRAKHAEPALHRRTQPVIMTSADRQLPKGHICSALHLLGCGSWTAGACSSCSWRGCVHLCKQCSSARTTGGSLSEGTDDVTGNSTGGSSLGIGSSASAVVDAWDAGSGLSMGSVDAALQSTDGVDIRCRQAPLVTSKHTHQPPPVPPQEHPSLHLHVETEGVRQWHKLLTLTSCQGSK